jgi:hypothetical protein
MSSQAVNSVDFYFEGSGIKTTNAKYTYSPKYRIPIYVDHIGRSRLFNCFQEISELTFIRHILNTCASFRREAYMPEVMLKIDGHIHRNN